MKIEKINENQIRCTLTREDLESRNVRLSELAYGTEKAKKLFNDMMQQAQIQFGFIADNIPLMIEAVPVSSDSIILIITKVEDPDELDTRFSKFSPYNKDTASSADSDPFHFDGADTILDLIQKLKQKRASAAEDPAEPKEKLPAEDASIPSLIRLYLFSSLDNVIAAAKSLNGFFNEPNILYKDQAGNDYLLVIHQGDASPENFNKVCNILSEYGDGRSLNPSGEAYLTEHGHLIVKNALNTLANL